VSGVLVGIIFSIEQGSFGTEGQRGENLQWLLWCAGQRYDDDVMNLECIARTRSCAGHGKGDGGWDGMYIRLLRERGLL